MDLYTFILCLIGVGSIPFIVICFFLRWEYNRTKQEARALRLAVNQAKSEFGKKGSHFVGEQIGELGIDGLFDELGVPGMLKPLAKGFIENLIKDPEKIKALAERFGVKLPEGGKPPGFF
jgi:hypothetical protein